jgi:hypothetical protein
MPHQDGHGRISASWLRLAHFQRELARCRSDVENEQNANGGSILPCRYVTRAEMQCCHTHSWLDYRIGAVGRLLRMADAPACRFGYQCAVFGN